MIGGGPHVWGFLQVFTKAFYQRRSDQFIPFRLGISSQDLPEELYLVRLRRSR